MKQYTRTIQMLLLLWLFLMVISVRTIGQVPPPPPPNGGQNNGHGLGGNQGPAGAPIADGLGLFFVLSMVYSAKKMVIRDNKVDPE
jgi:hypothetical protein